MSDETTTTAETRPTLQVETTPCDPLIVLTVHEPDADEGGAGG